MKAIQDWYTGRRSFLIPVADIARSLSVLAMTSTVSPRSRLSHCRGARRVAD